MSGRDVRGVKSGGFKGMGESFSRLSEARGRWHQEGGTDDHSDERCAVRNSAGQTGGREHAGGICYDRSRVEGQNGQFRFAVMVVKASTQRL